MNLAALQHKAFDNFCYPLDENTLEINLLTAKDVKKVILVYGDPFSGGIMGGDWKWQGTELEMVCSAELQFNYKWTQTIKPEFKRARYYFKIYGENESFIFCEKGICDIDETLYYGFFTFPWMNPCDVIKVPEWAVNTVWYQIFPSRFSRGKTRYKQENLLEWAEPDVKMEHVPGKPEPCYGGNLSGIIDRLAYLKELGISGIYMTPINKAHSQHKYDTTDYLKIDPSFGDRKIMKKLVRASHERGIRVMLDGVFNHSGYFFKPWQDVLKKREKSKYKDWFMINDFDFGEPGFGKNGNAGKGKFYSFAFVDYMPKLNTNNPRVRDYICSVCERWVKDYDIDGLRLDVANEISHVLCQELRTRMNKLKPDFYIIGEIWHNSLPWLRGGEFDSVMNYPLQNSIADFCIDEKISSKDFEYAINNCYSMYPRQINRVLFNQMDSHDTIRILNRMKMDKDLARLALVLLFSMPGSACIYYGTEILLEGGHDPDCRRCMPWSHIQNGEYDKELAFMKALIHLRKTHPAMTGSYISFCKTASETVQSNRVVKFEKTSEDKAEKLLVIVNCGNESVSCPEISGQASVLFSQNYKDSVLGENGFVIVSL